MYAETLRHKTWAGKTRRRKNDVLSIRLVPLIRFKSHGVCIRTPPDKFGMQMRKAERNCAMNYNSVLDNNPFVLNCV